MEPGPDPVPFALPPHDVEVLVAGAGPAGRALAAALRARGVEAACLDPAPHAPWPARYCLFHDQADALGLLPFAREVWAETWMKARGRLRPLHRGYVLLENDALARHLGEGVPLYTGRLAAVEEVRGGVRVDLEGGDAVRARAVIRATGAVCAEPPTAQTAYGVTLAPVRSFDAFVPSGGALLMDFSGGGAQGAATFLYAHALRDGALFVEETSLAASPPLPIEALRARLLARIGEAGFPMSAVNEAHPERCFIPLAGRAPCPSRHALYGGAAGAVHPMTGYSLVASLSLAPLTAAAVAEACARGGTGQDIAQATHAALWPAPRRRTRALQGLGLELVTSLGPSDTEVFFDALFSGEDASWRIFMEPFPAPVALAHAMRALLPRLPERLQKHLYGLALLRHPKVVPEFARSLWYRS